MRKKRKDKKRKSFLFYPEDKFKLYWGSIMTIVLLFTCVMTPYFMAFKNDELTTSTLIIEIILDVVFFIDLIVNFLSPFYD